jgi:hypothetical protein
MRPRRIRSVGPLGTLVVVAFLASLVSAPVRACFSHHGHDHGVFAYAAGSASQDASPLHERHAPHRGHGISDASPAPDSGPEGAQEGCECLGACQLETAPHLPLSVRLAHTVAPGPDEPPKAGEVLGPTQCAPLALPPARAPPALG